MYKKSTTDISRKDSITKFAHISLVRVEKHPELFITNADCDQGLRFNETLTLRGGMSHSKSKLKYHIKICGYFAVSR